jgi:hypothetical protein
MKTTAGVIVLKKIVKETATEIQRHPVTAFAMALLGSVNRITKHYQRLQFTAMFTFLHNILSHFVGDYRRGMDW